MKIAMFGQRSIPSRQGGVEVVVTQLSTHMAAKGHSVVCYNRTEKHNSHTRKQWEGVRLEPVWTVDIKGLAAVSSSFFAAIRSACSDADVVHIHAEGPAALCWLPKLLGKRVVVTVHGLDWQREKWANGLGSAYIRAGERMAARYADAVIVLSRNAQSYFQQTYGRETVWIPNGMEPAQMEAPQQIVRRFGLEPGGYFLFLGRLVPEKGIHYLLEAFRQVKTGKKLVIAGSPSDTEAYAGRLREMAQDDRRVVFTGFAGEELRRELYSHAYGFVLPSDLEGMPLSLMEAMSYGNCCVVSDIPECLEVIEQRGLVFPRGSVSDLRDILQRLCDEPELAEQYRQRAKSRTYMDWDSVAEKTLALYRNVVPGKEAAAWKSGKRI